MSHECFAHPLSRLQLDNEHIKFAWYWRQSCRERAQSRSLRFMRLSCRLPTSRISCSQLDQRYVSVKSHRCGLACLLIPIPRPMTRTPAISIWPSVYHERSPARCSKKLNSCSHVCIIIIIFSRRWFAALEPINMSWLLIILSPSGIRIATCYLLIDPRINVPSNIQATPGSANIMAYTDEVPELACILKRWRKGAM